MKTSAVETVRKWTKFKSGENINKIKILAVETFCQEMQKNYKW